MLPAIFLDRDGVIIENRENYVRTWEDVVFIPQAVAALASMCTRPFHIILVTNQSAVGRGLIPLKTAQEINEKLIAALRLHGVRIDSIFMCPHAPHDQCDCRKPKPGLILQAAQAFAIDLSQSIMIGDAWSDLHAGYAAGIRTNVLVLTGRGQEQLLLPRPKEIQEVKIFASLAEALRALVTDQ
jgi:D-glycero-D-manno-heptose 1,7-bisphosphate phosphatase